MGKRTLLQKKQITAPPTSNCQEIDDKTEFTPDKRILRLLDSSPVWRDDVLGYIGGYIVKQIIPSTKCVECVDAMVAEDQTTIPDHLSYTQVCPNTSNKLIALKSYHNGALTIPSPSVLKVVHITDKILRRKLHQWHLLNKKALQEIKQEVLKEIKSSTCTALQQHSRDCHILDHYGTGNSVRVFLFDYRKAFDLIDHTILVNKICLLSIPSFVKNWIIDFLSNRKQRVKLAKDCFSEWGRVPCGVPQGTKLGPWLFILMINDLRLSEFSYWKYVDDTTASETVPKNESSHFQSGANELVTWTDQNKFQLHDKKCKELLIQFQKERAPFPGVQINSGCPELVHHAKILGLTITDDLKWTKHVTEIIKKANKRIYFVVQLKRAKVPPKEIITFYCSCVRPVLEYSSEAYHFALPAYLSDAIERIQRRVTS